MAFAKELLPVEEAPSIVIMMLSIQGAKVRPKKLVFPAALKRA